MIHDSLNNSDQKKLSRNMIKFKGPSSMMQYIKQKPVEWGFQFWFGSNSYDNYLHIVFKESPLIFK